MHHKAEERMEGGRITWYDTQKFCPEMEVYHSL